VVKGRSINMALSRRGRDALAYVNCEDVIVRNGIAMRARMLHDLNCHTQPVPYGTRPDHVIGKKSKIKFFFFFNFKRKLYQLIVVFLMNFY
jgi:kynurenine 3-monooxygenase